jgi:hypothetical protein
VNQFTPTWEKEYLDSHSRGHLLSSLEEVLTLLDT